MYFKARDFQPPFVVPEVSKNFFFLWIAANLPIKRPPFSRGDLNLERPRFYHSSVQKRVLHLSRASLAVQRDAFTRVTCRIIGIVT